MRDRQTDREREREMSKVKKNRRSVVRVWAEVLLCFQACMASDLGSERWELKGPEAFHAFFVAH